MKDGVEDLLRVGILKFFTRYPPVFNRDNQLLLGLFICLNFTGGVIIAIDQKLIDEINALAHKKKTVGLTPEEQVRQQKLRQKYLKEFRRGFEQQLQSIKVVDANGNDVTPAKARMHKKIN